MQVRLMVASHIDSSPGDPQAGKQGKEGLVSSAFLIQWTFVLYFLSIFLFSLSFAQMPCC